MSKNSLFSVSTLLLLLLSGCQTDMVVFNPQGPVAKSILELINLSLVWMLLVVVVVFSLFAYIVWKYREKPENIDYEPPDEEGSTVLEVIWTVIPILILIALTIPTVKTLYQLEEIPKGYEDKKPIIIHVTSADWKWIFSYPDHNIETVNYVNIPAGVPIDFRLTSASTMQSFWVPALGGQKYTMGKMETQMYLVADNPGSFLGKNTNFNGRGYAEMEFEVLALTQFDFDKWVSEVQQTAPTLTEKKYEEILRPTHLGRLTFTNTHLEWVNHAEVNSPTYTNPELYRGHGYPGKIFEKDDSYKNKTERQIDGGGHDGH
jgi:cytochrome aa3-600 menaquinol oxidase subunit 2